MIVNYWYRIRLVGIMYCVPPAYVNTQREIGSQTRVSIVLMILTPPSCQFSYLTIVCKFTFSKLSVCFKRSNTKNVNKTIHYSCRQLLFCRSINLVSTLNICSSMKLYALLLINIYVKKCTLLNLHLLGVVIYVLCR